MFLNSLAILRVVYVLLTASAKPLLMLLSYHARIPSRHEYMLSDTAPIAWMPNAWTSRYQRPRTFYADSLSYCL